ncbi:hypothetical protein VNI00_015118 [Paramarasmius palmivorus]|uniref:Mid2 domain-containing protein n=1 Tax=Paramarasmius palmivorus TaxID=297713 RepID=A0AAW0BQZ3_9AGAR
MPFVPDTVTVNISAVAEWRWIPGDPATFGFLLRRNDQDKGGELIAVASSSDSPGQITFTVNEEGLEPNEQPKQIFASTGGFSAISDPDSPPTSTPTSSTSPLPSMTQTIAFEHTTANLPPTTNTTSSTQQQLQTPQPSGTGPIIGSNSASKVGRIAGPVVGVVVLIILVAVGFILSRRRKTSLYLRKSAEALPYPNTTSASNVAGEKMRQLKWLDRKADTAARISTETESPSREDVFSSIAGNDAQENTEDSPPMRTRRVLYHDDSGWRPSAPRSDAGNSSVLEMPPRYDAAV